MNRLGRGLDELLPQARSVGGTIWVAGQGARKVQRLRLMVGARTVLDFKAMTSPRDDDDPIPVEDEG